MRRWYDWDWQMAPEEPRSWADSAELLVSMNHIKDAWDGPVRARAAAALYHANVCGMLAVVRCNAEALRDLRDGGPMHKTIIPAAFARTQAELDAVAAELLQVGASCRALWLEPMERVDLSETLFCDECRTGPYGSGVVEDLVSSANGGKPWSICGCAKPDWVVASGGSDPLHPAWVRSIRDQCAAAGVPFCFRSWGEFVPIDQRPLGTNSTHIKAFALRNKKQMWNVGRERSGALLDGVLHDERPEVAR